MEEGKEEAECNILWLGSMNNNNALAIKLAECLTNIR